MRSPKSERSHFALRRSYLLGVLIVLALFGAITILQVRLDRARAKAEMLKGVDEMMYFPSGKLLNQISGEYKPLFADYAWLRAVQYYAFHMVTDQQYEWLEHIVRIAVQLDPKFLDAYRFGSMAMSWDADQPRQGIALLRDGMIQNQMSWELPFDAAFIAYQKIKDYALAAHYFEIAAQLPDVWSIVPRWAAFASEKTGNVDLARQIWAEIWRNQPNPKLKDIARRQLGNLLKEEIDSLQSATDRFARDQGRAPATFEEIVAAGDLEEVPQEPFGGRYILRSGQVVSTTVEQTRVLMARLQAAVDTYWQRRRVFPTSVDELVDAGLILEVPPEPMGGEWSIENGRVTTTSQLP